MRERAKHKRDRELSTRERAKHEGGEIAMHERSARERESSARESERELSTRERELSMREKAKHEIES